MGLSHSVIEDMQIHLEDGTRLFSRVWMPDQAAQTPVPAILEFLPYRRRDGTAPRDESTYPVFAEAGYAGVRVDARGQGDSDGAVEDEYSPQELADIFAVIAWLADQPWCDGNVGMMGISWGGFNSIQLAAMRPPALKAVISISTTADRYNDDIHYKGGALLSSNFYWSATMFSYASRVPDPEILGNGWFPHWIERLHSIDVPAHLWMAHPNRDAYWQHGSVCENWEAIQIPVLGIGGWADGYRNAPSDFVANLNQAAPAKAILGPWVHKYPHFAKPAPNMDFHSEAIRWWDRWLKGVANGAETLPSYRAYMTEAIEAGLPWRAADPGRWVAREAIMVNAGDALRLNATNDGSLVTEQTTLAAPVTVATDMRVGSQSGEYFTLAPREEMAGNQQADDDLSVCFETDILAEAIEIMGRPTLCMRVTIDRPFGHVIARLVDVAPDRADGTSGTAYRVSWGVVNLARATSQAVPESVAGTTQDVEINFDYVAHRFRPGHKIRLALSTSYFPLITPAPWLVSAQLEEALALSLPLATDVVACDVPEAPASAVLPSYAEVSPPEYIRSHSYDPATDQVQFHMLDDTGTSRHPHHGMESRDVRDERWSVAKDDPLCVRGECIMTSERGRAGWHTKTVARQTITADVENWYLHSRLTAWHDGVEVFDREFDQTIPRDHH